MNQPRVRWYVYMLYSVSTGRLYTGISTSPNRRLEQHNGNKDGGAKSTRMGRPWKVVYVEECATQGDALQREIAIKKLKRAAKLLLAGLAS